MRGLIAALALLAVSSAAEAQKTKQDVTASNGVVVSVTADDFAGRREVASPIIEAEIDGGGKVTALVGQVKNQGKFLGLTVQGFVMYRGDWRFYDSAIYRGGDPVQFRRTDSEVISCSGARYGAGCSMSENFMIELTPADVAKYASDGVLTFRVQGKRGASFMLNVPATYFAAVVEQSR